MENANERKANPPEPRTVRDCSELTPEILAQLAVGTYHKWFCSIHCYSWTDPPGLEEILAEYLPFYERFSEGYMNVIASEEQLTTLTRVLRAGNLASFGFERME